MVLAELHRIFYFIFEIRPSWLLPDRVPHGHGQIGGIFLGNDAESNWMPFARLPDPYLWKIEAAHTRPTPEPPTVYPKKEKVQPDNQTFLRSVIDWLNNIKMYQNNKNDKNDS